MSKAESSLNKIKVKKKTPKNTVVTKVALLINLGIVLLSLFSYSP